MRSRATMLSVVAMRDPLLEVIAAMVRFEPPELSGDAESPPLSEPDAEAPAEEATAQPE